MIRVYEGIEFLELAQAVKYLQLLSKAPFQKKTMVRLLNEKVIPCYVDASDLRGYTTGLMNKTHVVGSGTSRLDHPKIRNNPEKKLYEATGVIEGLTTEIVSTQVLDIAPMSRVVSAVSIRKWRAYDDNTDPNKSRSAKPYGHLELFIRPVDVKEYWSSVNSLNKQQNSDEDTTPANLLVIGGLLQLLSDPDFCKRFSNKKPTQDLIATIIEDHLDVSKSTMTKLFGAANKKLNVVVK